MSTEIKEGVTLAAIVNKLVGNITPIGKSEVDEDRFENLKVMCELVNLLIIQIDNVSYDNKDRHEASMRKAGEYAHNFITNTIGIK